MSHFAQVVDGIVTQVIVAEQDVIDSGLFGTGWVQTSYNTRANQHPENRPLRGNYAGVGYVYDAQNDVFYAPQPFASWALDTNTWTWDAPSPMPTDGKIYRWNEATLNWVLDTLTEGIQMSVSLSLFAGAGQQFFSDSGVPLAGGLVYTYAAGTTTPQAAYTSSTGVTPHTNPIVLDSAGRVPSEIWLTDNVSYKFILEDSTNVQIGSYDNISGQGTIIGDLYVSGDITVGGTVNGLGGLVLQTVKFVTSTRTTTTGTSYVNSAVTASITPTSATSKILILCSASQQIYDYSTEMNTRVVRGASTEVTGSYRIYKTFLISEGTAKELWVPTAFTVVDEPATTSATTYTVQLKAQGFTSGTVAYGSNDANASTMILMEISQ